MRKMEALGGVLAASAALHFGSLGMFGATKPEAKAAKPSCISLNHNERIISTNPYALLFGPEKGYNKQYYMDKVIDKGTVVETLQKPLHGMSIEREVSLDLKDVTKTHSIEATFKDAAPDVTVIFKAYEHESAIIVEAQACKA